MTQPLFCSTASPWGIHLSIRDNMCARCGWTAPRFNRSSIGVVTEGIVTPLQPDVNGGSI
jgi:hypothetical protein